MLSLDGIFLKNREHRRYLAARKGFCPFTADPSPFTVHRSGGAVGLLTPVTPGLLNFCAPRLYGEPPSVFGKIEFFRFRVLNERTSSNIISSRRPAACHVNINLRNR